MRDVLFGHHACKQPSMQLTNLGPNYKTNKRLEWLFQQSGDVVIVGLMMREFGAGVNQTIFEEVVAQLRRGTWTLSHTFADCS